ncbi:TetR/AcrR family transcriptional regulator [uncultured Methylobacterium sp.]|jgi:AcrR family transcriptional regulator|uniref:TetR/AcrR family transcriptional regulator n=1 Tax=uncultured Methylobacterium sp. TaxID=157278 RepID=UPI00260D3997|nr:TetR/AcrR family transcriptional regulator [uncultured Methylobacterium sp.]
MARPRSEDRRNAIVSAAIRVIAAHGLDASTAAIAKEAGVSNGSLFTYFETKADLLNQVYVDLKREMAAASLDALPADDEPGEQMRRLWSQRLRWAASCPAKHRTLAHLLVCDEITPASREIGQRTMADIIRLLERTHEDGPMRGAPMVFVMGLIGAVANVTVDFMIQDPGNAETHCRAGFEAIWRMLSQPAA